MYLPPRIEVHTLSVTDVAIALFQNAVSQNALSQSAVPGWFALTVQPNHERTAERGLLNHGLETYLPVHRVRRRWSDRQKDMDVVLFPGYLFCRFARPDLMRVLGSPSVRSVVGSGRSPLPVDDSEISAVKALVSSGRPILPWPYLRIGQHVMIDRGPLAYVRGVVVRVKDSCRAVVSVEALGCSLSVEVDSEALVPDTVSETVCYGCQ
jgi:transcription antitermination factor NusG